MTLKKKEETPTPKPPIEPTPEPSSQESKPTASILDAKPQDEKTSELYQALLINDVLLFINRLINMLKELFGDDQKTEGWETALKEKLKESLTDEQAKALNKIFKV